MPRKGKFLETVVEKLERFLSVEGVTVQSPELFYNEGTLVGEIDITLRGNFGSSKIFIGVECRDRPADGPQGIDWIRTLRGKQEHLKVDKMIAVSSTGFRTEAIKLAEDFNIDLLTLTEADLNTDVLKNWVKATEFNVVLPAFRFGGDIQIVAKDAKSGSVDVDQDTEYLRLQGQNKLKSVRELILPHAIKMLEQFQISGKESWDTGIRHAGPIQAVFPDGEFTIDELRVPLKFWRETVKAKMVLSAYKPPNEDMPKALAGIAHVQGNNIEFKILALQKDIPGGKDLRVSFLTLDGKPMPVRGKLEMAHPEHGTLLEVDSNSELTELEKYIQDDYNTELKKNGFSVTCTGIFLNRTEENLLEGYAVLSSGEQIPALVRISGKELLIEIPKSGK